MTKPTQMFFLAGALSGVLLAALASQTAHAQFSDEQMKAMLASADTLGQGQATSDICGTDMTAMSAAVARGWKCQGGTAEQITKLQAAVAASRKGAKLAACPSEKAAHAQQVAKSTADLEAGLAKANCKG
jgi:K+-sensing histidine kinase KdpD